MNTGIYRANELLFAAFKAEGFNTVTFGTVSETDLDKQNIFPMAHMTLVDRALTGNTDTFNYTLQLLDVIDFNSLDPRESKNEMGLTNNVEDIFHDLGYRFNRAWLSFRKDVTNIVEVDDSITLTAGYHEAQNYLAGYEATITLTIPNTGDCD